MQVSTILTMGIGMVVFFATAACDKKSEMKSIQSSSGNAASSISLNELFLYMTFDCSAQKGDSDWLSLDTLYSTFSHVGDALSEEQKKGMAAMPSIFEDDSKSFQFILGSVYLTDWNKGEVNIQMDLLNSNSTTDFAPSFTYKLNVDEVVANRKDKTQRSIQGYEFKIECGESTGENPLKLMSVNKILSPDRQSEQPNPSE